MYLNKFIIDPKMAITIIYATENGTSFKYATRLSHVLKLPHDFLCFSECTLDLTSDIYIIIVSTYFDGKPPRSAQKLYSEIQDLYNDHRVERNHFSFKYTIFGLGSRAYGADFNIVARNLHTWLSGLGATRLVKCRYGDEYGDMDECFSEWSKIVCDKISSMDIYLPIEESDSESNEVEVSDIEDINKKMVTGTIYKNLTKQGYKVVGSHSAVKLCRWTKSMLKGQGGCYKHTFYGIKSLSCMEITPSLACANKCVFCWRHYTNPVGKSWKWTTDEPRAIFDGLLGEHRKMIENFRHSNVPLDKIENALQIKHCALSLVGEPIMYPRINELIDILHQNRISTFLVTNAQFPDQLKKLRKVTQLYLSIDSPEKEELREIDRPLHMDFWERYLECIDILKNRSERTVFRITLIKGKNDVKHDKYRDLIRKGEPDFIEIKGVTFCGYKNKDEMTMSNVPFYIEAEDFAKTLLIEGYRIACVHEHTVSVLIAKDKYFVDGKWCTWIDYDRFFDVLESDTFTGLDYSIETPHWGIVGAEEKGFNPSETRRMRNKMKNNN